MENIRIFSGSDRKKNDIFLVLEGGNLLGCFSSYDDADAFIKAYIRHRNNEIYFKEIREYALKIMSSQEAIEATNEWRKKQKKN